MANRTKAPPSRRPRAAAQPITGGRAPGTAPTRVASGVTPLQRGVERPGSSPGSRRATAAASGPERQQEHASPSSAQEAPEQRRPPRAGTRPGRQRALPGAVHQRVGAPLDDLVEDARPRRPRGRCPTRAATRSARPGGRAGEAVTKPTRVVKTTMAVMRGLVSSTQSAGDGAGDGEGACGCSWHGTPGSLAAGREALQTAGLASASAGGRRRGARAGRRPPPSGCAGRRRPGPPATSGGGADLGRGAQAARRARRSRASKARISFSWQATRMCSPTRSGAESGREGRAVRQARLPPRVRP